MTQTEFDPTPYQKIPVLDVAGLVALGLRLQAELPKALPEPARAQAKKMRTALADLQEAHGKIPAPAASRAHRKAADQRIDNAWGALFDRLSPWRRLPAESSPDVERATQIINRIFPEGLTFLSLAYESEWVESSRRLTTLADEGLMGTLESLVGKPFVTELLAAHAHYGETLGMTGARQESAQETTSLREPMDALRKAMAAYSRALVGLVDEDDVASITRVEKALSPLIEARRSSTTPKGTGNEPNQPPAEG